MYHQKREHEGKRYCDKEKTAEWSWSWNKSSHPGVICQQVPGVVRVVCLATDVFPPAKHPLKQEACGATVECAAGRCDLLWLLQRIDGRLAAC